MTPDAPIQLLVRLVDIYRELERTDPWLGWAWSARGWPTTWRRRTALSDRRSDVD